jgi:hypothetical protein
MDPVEDLDPVNKEDLAPVIEVALKGGAGDVTPVLCRPVEPAKADPLPQIIKSVDSMTMKPPLQAKKPSSRSAILTFMISSYMTPMVNLPGPCSHLKPLTHDSMLTPVPEEGERHDSCQTVPAGRGKVHPVANLEVGDDVQPHAVGVSGKSSSIVLIPMNPHALLKPISFPSIPIKQEPNHYPVDEHSVLPRGPVCVAHWCNYTKHC